jgi:hypothetical protein
MSSGGRGKNAGKPLSPAERRQRAAASKRSPWRGEGRMLKRKPRPELD